ncbi:MAG TPA: hypothetical protein VIP46_21280 [Pyrinomonadaceae bacterium]
MSDNTRRRLDASLELVRDHCHPLLMSPDSFTRIRNVARSWPRFAVDFFGFECRLGTTDGPTDCAMNLTPDGARMLAGRSEFAPPPALQDGPWEKLRRFFQEWGDTRQTPYADATSAWLEFDSSDEAPAPNLLFGYWPDKPETRRPPEWLAETVLPILLGDSVPAALKQNLLRCLEARPARTRDFQIGVMFSRSFQAVRLCVFDLPEDDIEPYLERIGWRGPRGKLREYVDGLRPHADFVALHLDMGEKIFPHIGVEPGFDASCWSRQPHLEPRWEGQFDQLSRFRLLLPEKKQALLAWIGHQRLPGDEETLLLRGLSHLKVVLGHDGGATAKAYFGITHRALGAAK